MQAAAVAPPVEHGQKDGTEEDEEEFVNLMQPPPRIKKKGKKGKKKKGPAADALAQLEELEVEKEEVRNGDTFIFLFFLCSEPMCSTSSAYVPMKGRGRPQTKGMSDLTLPPAAVHGLGSLFANHKVESTSTERDRDRGATHAVQFSCVFLELVV